MNTQGKPRLAKFYEFRVHSLFIPLPIIFLFFALQMQFYNIVFVLWLISLWKSNRKLFEMCLQVYLFHPLTYFIFFSKPPISFQTFKVTLT